MERAFGIIFANGNRGYDNRGFYLEVVRMKFFDREREIALLREIRGRSREVAQFSVVTGHRARQDVAQ